MHVQVVVAHVDILFLLFEMQRRELCLRFRLRRRLCGHRHALTDGAGLIAEHVVVVHRFSKEHCGRNVLRRLADWLNVLKEILRRLERSRVYSYREGPLELLKRLHDVRLLGHVLHRQLLLDVGHRLKVDRRELDDHFPDYFRSDDEPRKRVFHEDELQLLAREIIVFALDRLLDYEHLVRQDRRGKLRRGEGTTV